MGGGEGEGEGEPLTMVPHVIPQKPLRGKSLRAVGTLESLFCKE